MAVGSLIQAHRQNRRDEAAAQQLQQINGTPFIGTALYSQTVIRDAHRLFCNMTASAVLLNSAFAGGSVIKLTAWSCRARAQTRANPISLSPGLTDSRS